MKELTPADLANLRELVSTTLTLIKYDDTGVTDDLIELALVAAEILEINPPEEPDEDD